MENKVLRDMRDGIRGELLENILPFWMKHVPDEKYGGFFGKISNALAVDERAPKGLILNARILWTFSAAHRFSPDPAFMQTADRAFDYLMKYFWDRGQDGFFWMVDFQGNPLNDKKKIYGQAFVVYALAEYHQAGGSSSALENARRLFRLIEDRGYDPDHTGYFETYERDWTLAKDLRLSEKDMNEAKSMNTHLHLMEAYTNLFRAWKDPLLEKRLEGLILNFRDRIIDRKSDRLVSFFNEAWEPRSDVVSFGHDIEASWLLCEAADILGNPALIKEMRGFAIRMAGAVYDRGRDGDGSLFYEADPSGIIDSDKHFWVQGEGVVGFLNACQLSGSERFLEAAGLCWEFIQKHLVDRKFGDWLYRVDKEGKPYLEVPKVSEWKCPYHSSRMCMEAISRLEKIITGSSV
jgi:mannobiose 2-epimerase